MQNRIVLMHANRDDAVAEELRIAAAAGGVLLETRAVPQLAGGRRPIRETEMRVDAETALSLAASAAQHGREMHGEPIEANIGIGLVMEKGDAAPQGSVRCFIATQTNRWTHLYSATFRPGRTAAMSVDRIAGQLLLEAAAEVCTKLVTHVRADFEMTLIPDVKVQAPELLSDVWRGAAPIAWALPDKSLCAAIDEPPAGILSGSFNPLHEGHRALKEAAEEWLRGPVQFELTLRNADKPPLDFITIARRVRQISPHSVALSGAATFVEKSTVFPDTTFVVGIDTAMRIVDRRFYQNREDRMRASLERIRKAGCRFLVAARKVDNRVLTLTDLERSADLDDLFEELPEDRFRLDVSSSERRGHGK